MKTKTYYFFCEGCGGDTAAYNLLVRCPYCHAVKATFLLLGDSEGLSDPEAARVVEQHRKKWSSKNGVAFADALPKKNRAWFRR
ncbi:MAG: hypothetical protein A2201_03440 [Alicyclobacillus sp. RIFOXYA1_FULL_53_8]|nr:MAG: hypothetical protein A2201_03440 [Alicyclobacillus sp. RIFOXYA1_FULL_53_8]